MSTGNMPARIWAWGGTASGWTPRKFINEIPAREYVRADIVERLAEAASKFVTVCSDKRGEWNGLSFIARGAIMDSFFDVRDALNSYREADHA